ncbi:MAG: hypothetical protein ACFFAL_05260 [Promethearchaeota archaeon]
MTLTLRILLVHFVPPYLLLSLPLKSHCLLNAEQFLAYNIGRKAVPEAFAVDGIEGVGLHPYSVTI